LQTMHISLRLMKKALLHPPYPKRVMTRFFPSFVLVSPTSSMYSTGKERILVRLGWAGETGTSAVVGSARGLAREWARLGAPGRAGEKRDLFDHPVASVKPLRDESP
jgi:hypothetical protein